MFDGNSLTTTGSASVNASIGIDESSWPDTPLVRARVKRVVDGDTFVATLDDATTVRVRLIGINAAESVAPQAWRNCAEGVVASECLKKLLPCGTCVWLQRDVSDMDEYGRLLRYVWLKQPVRVDSTSEIRAHMLNAMLVERGIASARSYPPDTSLDLLFSSLED